jgi:hypothetical protein
MKKLLELLGKTRKYLAIAMGYLVKLVTFGKKAEKVLEEAEDKLEDEVKK